ncbi:P-loop ATPase, Sll1717 family [Sphingobium ummariense]
MKTAFFAYPGETPIVGEAVKGVIELADGDSLSIKPWEKMRIVGLKLDDLIRDEIREANLLIADVTYPNFNVYYEMGFAAAVGRPVIPTVNIAVEKATKRLSENGLFDTLGWATYANADELHDKLKEWESIAWSTKFYRPKDHSQPLFVLDCLKKTDFRNHIIAAIDNSHVRYRAFDPSEVPRLTAAQAVESISASAGAIIPILSDDIVDANRHNLRAAFLLGLAHGFDLEPLALQYGNGPAPADYRDFITNSTFRKETFNHVEAYCAQTLIRNQEVSARSRRDDLGLLGQIDLGSPVAEYETQQLKDYFIRTAEFARAIRAEGGVVIGRKGAGKSAIYFQVIANLQRDRERCIVDLRPASHNLSEMRESLLSVVAVGVFDHTIAAFWQYVMLLEALLKIREDVLPKSKNNFALQERIRAIEEEFSLDESVVAGDFTSRLKTAIDLVVSALVKARSDQDVRSQITNLLFERPIPRLREAILSFADFFSEVVILIDDLDKGWPPLQVESHDVATIRHLIEVLNKIQRDLSRRGLGFRHLVFLRSDIYERLVEQTSDRGKYNVIKVDWSDPEQLRHLLWERIVSTLDKSHHEDAWAAINPEITPGVTAIDKLIESSLRRPRFLIDVMERTLSFAINRGHGFVTTDDVNEGARQMSLYLVSDFAYEMRDLAGTPEDIFYAFIGAPAQLSHEQLESILAQNNLGLEIAEVIELLLWYGFLGVLDDQKRPIFIYDRAYDFRRLEAERGPVGPSVQYSINPAFLLGLIKA